jgi:hypothetical protein
MDYDFFHSLTADEARSYLARFLTVEQQAINALQTCASQDAVEFDYSMSKLADTLKWFAKRVHINYVPIPEGVPDWVRNSHPRGVREFDEESKSVVLRAAYYLGECFARLPGLQWATGDSDYMEKNMPVIVGFRGGQELPPLLICETLFKRIADGGSLERIDSTLDSWLRDCPLEPR